MFLIVAIHAIILALTEKVWLARPLAVVFIFIYVSIPLTDQVDYITISGIFLCARWVIGDLYSNWKDRQLLFDVSPVTWIGSIEHTISWKLGLSVSVVDILFKIILITICSFGVHFNYTELILLLYESFQR